MLQSLTAIWLHRTNLFEQSVMHSERLGSMLNSRALHSATQESCFASQPAAATQAAHRLRDRETWQNASCQGEDEDCCFHNPRTIWRFDCPGNRCGRRASLAVPRSLTTMRGYVTPGQAREGKPDGKTRSVRRDARWRPSASALGGSDERRQVTTTQPHIPQFAIVELIEQADLCRCPVARRQPGRKATQPHPDP